MCLAAAIASAQVPGDARRPRIGLTLSGGGAKGLAHIGILKAIGSPNVSIQRILQAISPALLHAAKFRKQLFVLKELQPSIDRLDLRRWRAKPRRLRQAVEGMGRVAAWAHLRGCGQHGGASVQVLQAYVRAQRWSREADRLGKRAAARMQRAWQLYCKDYDAGAVSAAVSNEP